jgi:hypothetical protein
MFYILSEEILLAVNLVKEKHFFVQIINKFSIISLDYELPSEFVYRHENDKLDEESGEHDNSDESPDSETVTEEDNEDEEREDTQEKEEEPNIKQLKHASKDGWINNERRKLNIETGY